LEKKVKYLVDTNVWLERLLDQDKSNVAHDFFEAISPENMFVSDFAIHSIGVILSRLKKNDILIKFLDDLFINGQIEQLTLDASDLLSVVYNMKGLELDFDDSYQYTVAKKYELTIVTFDKDFNSKGINKKSPDEVLGIS
jgi:hypothetical protein